MREEWALSIAIWSVILMAVFLAVYFMTGWRLAEWAAISVAWVYVLVTVGRYIGDARMRKLIGVVIMIVGAGYAYQAVVSATASNSRENASFISSLVVSVICLGVGSVLLVTKGGKR